MLIGGGSAMFTQDLLADLIASGKPWEVGLVDIDPQILKVAEGLSRSMVALTKADIRAAASLKRKDLLRGVTWW